MAKNGRVTNSYLLIPFLKSKLTKIILEKVNFDSPYFEPLPWQHHLRHKFENYLKACTNSKCKRSESFNLIA